MRAVQALASVIIIIIVSKKRSAGRSRSRYETSSFYLALPLLLLVSVSAAEQSQRTHRVVSRPPWLHLCVPSGGAIQRRRRGRGSVGRRLAVALEVLSVRGFCVSSEGD